MTNTDHYQIPVDHDPFAMEHQVLPPELANLPPGKALELIMKFDARMFNMELALVQSVHEMRQVINTMAQEVKGLSASHERLRAAIKAPKKIMRDENGRPSGVVLDKDV
jgi:hypothetical protein